MLLSTTLALMFLGIALEAFFSGSEIGLISINRLRMQQKADQGDRAAKAVLKLLDTPERLFAATSLGTNLAMVSTTAIFTAYMVFHLGDTGEWLAGIIITPLILFGGEIVPKMVIHHRPNIIMPYLVHPLNGFCKIANPLIHLFTRLSRYFTASVTHMAEDKFSTMSREQIRNILSLEAQAIDLGATERTLIHKIFNFGEIPVEQCMVPLVQMTAIPDTITLRELHEVANDSGFSRLPVYHENMYNLIGIVNTFDLLNQPVDDTPVSTLIRPAYYVPPNKKTDDLLKELQQRGLHMAIVVDEYGGCTGIVTIEDLLEEIVGEIEDEYDKQEKRYEDYSDGGYLIEADMEISAINETLKLNLPSGD
ncbi:MAG: HlyC/CorC family transporter, partial [Nitrospinaceae bacterium]